MKSLPDLIGVVSIGLMILSCPLNAQTQESSPIEVHEDTPPTTPNFPLQLSEEQIRQACAAKRYDMLPIPFSDVSPTDWAFEAVMNLYYCIGLPPQFESHSSSKP